MYMYMYMYMYVYMYMYMYVHDAYMERDWCLIYVECCYKCNLAASTPPATDTKPSVTKPAVTATPSPAPAGGPAAGGGGALSCVSCQTDLRYGFCAGIFATLSCLDVFLCVPMCFCVFLCVLMCRDWGGAIFLCFMCSYLFRMS